MKRLRFRLTAGFILVIMLVLIILGIYNAKLFENTYIDTLSSRLEKEAMLISKSFNWESMIRKDYSTLARQVETWSASGDARVTIIDREGTVLADSEVSYQEMENHRSRAEVVQALQGETGTSLRYSHTTSKDTIYVAVPLYVKEDLAGVIRLAYPIQLAKTKVHQLWLGQFVALLIIFLLSSYIGSRIAKGLTGPIEKITEVARDITRQRFGTKISIEGKGEIAELARVINYMSENLEKQMRQIRENEKKLSDVLTNMFSGVILVDQHGHILLSNRASQQILNKTQADLIGRSYSEVTKNLDLRQWIEEVFRYKKGLRNELHLYYPEEKIVDTSLAPLFDEYNAFVGVVIVLHDITEIRRLEKIRSDFVANASHELKTPVTSIRGFTETLLDGAMYEEELLHSFLQIINKESERLQRLIDDILDLSKIEQKKLSLEVKPCHMESIINDVILHVQTDLEKKGIQFSGSIPGDLVIEADPDRLKQIFINLIVNAIQYTPEKGKVWIETEVKDDKVIFAVCDTGVGIPKQDLRRVFERFYRVDKARSRHSGGTGLGLAIVKHLVESHHGRIWVESVEGKGSKFFVELPKENKKFS